MDEFLEKHKLKFLILILIISIFFRYYNWQLFQFWSFDEEVATAVVEKMIVSKQITLVSPNSTLNLGLGSFFHILSAFLFAITRFEPTTLLLITTSLGVVTTLIMYWLGKTFADTKTGLVTSLLYSASFLITLYDKRWWPFTINCLLTSASLLALFKIVREKKYYYSIILAISVGFAFHSDPTPAVIVISSLVVFAIFKINIFRKKFIPAVIVLIIFILPLLISELYHPSTITSPFLKIISKTTHINTALLISSRSLNPTISAFAGLFFTQASKFAEHQFCYCQPETPPLFNNFSKIIVTILIIYPLYAFYKRRSAKRLIIIPYVFLLVFFVTTQIVRASLNLPIHQHYMTIIFPIIFLLVGYSLTRIIKDEKVLITILVLFVSINVWTLLHSSFKYSLIQKEMLIKELLKTLGASNFSFYAVGSTWLQRGGYTSLFALNGKIPSKSYVYRTCLNVCKEQGLLPENITEKDQEKIVVIGEKGKLPKLNLNVISSKTVGNLEGKIYDNSSFTFNEELLSSF